MPIYPRAKHSPAEPSADGRLWYIILGVPQHLVRVYELLVTASEVSLARSIYDPEAGAQSLAFAAVLSQARTRVDAIAGEVAGVAQDRARELVRATQKRPAGSGRLESAVVASPVLIPGVSARGFGAVGVGNIHILDGAVVNPYTGSDKSYWRAQEDGSGHLLGKSIPGVFQPGEAAPAASMNRQHPTFEARPYYPGLKYWMTIRHAIKGRHFLKTAAGEAYTLRRTLFESLEAQMIAEVTEIDAGTHPNLARFRR